MRWRDDLAADVRYAARQLTKSPAFSIVAVLSLALGLGANIAVAVLLDAVVFRTLPVPSPEELVLLGERAPERETFSWSRTQLTEFSQSPALAGLCAFRPRIEIVVESTGGADVARGQLVSGRCFDVLRVRAAIGRMLTAEDDDAGEARPAAVIGHGFWQRYFGGDPAAIGRTLRVRGRAFTIVGVTPPEFLGLEPGRAVDVTVPLSHAPIVAAQLAASPTVRWLRLIGRVAPGVAPDRAAADLERRWRQPAAGRPPASDARLEVLSGAQGLNDLRREFSASLRILAAGVGLLLIVTCANLASLLLARARSRDLELRVRTALGASRGRMVRQLLTESCLLSALGGAAGLGLAVWGARTIVAALSRGREAIALPPFVDARLIGFAVALTCFTALVFGAWPAFRATRHVTLTSEASRTATRRGGRSAALIAAQTGVSAILLTAAILFARSLVNLQSVDLGLDARQVVLAGIRPGVAGIDRTRIPQLYRDLYVRLSGAPGVRAVSMAMDLPLGGISATSAVAVPPAKPADDVVNFNFVGPRFFETMGIPIVSGRDLTLADDERSRPVAVVSAALASRYFPGRDAVGERLDTGTVVVEIVGVAADVPYTSVRTPRELMLYRPYLQAAGRAAAMTFAVRTDLGTRSTADVIRTALRAIAPAVPLSSIDTLEARIDGSIPSERMLASISAFFGVMALLLVAIGVYGTLAYAIAQRTRELGIRQALGAAPGDVARLVLRGALTPVCAGLAIGLPFMLMASQMTRDQLFGITPADPTVYGAAVVVLLGAALAATLLPTRRAVRVDPLTALRDE